MKTLAISAAIALTALTGAASAMTTTDTYAERQIQAFAPDADLSALSNGEVLHILKEIRSNDGTTGETTAAVRSLLNAFQ